MNAEPIFTDLTEAQRKAIVKRLGGSQGAIEFLRGELEYFEPVCEWREKDGVIYFNITSDGTTNRQWEKDSFISQNYSGDYAKSVILSNDFKTTSKVTTEIAVIKEELFEEFFREESINIENIRLKSYSGIFTQGRKLFDPDAEVAFLIPKNLSDYEIEMMGLSHIITMHKPIMNLDGKPCLLVASRSHRKKNFIVYTFASNFYGEWDYKQKRGYGFAFAISQTRDQSAK